MRAGVRAVNLKLLIWIAAVRRRFRYDLDRPGRAGAALHLHRDGAADPDLRAAGGAAHAHRHLPQHRHSGDRRGLQLCRPVARRHVGARIITPYERILSTTVNDIEHIESQSLPGIGIVKIFFQPDVDIRTATAQVTSHLPDRAPPDAAGHPPPLILNYNASTVPVLQLAFSSKALSEQQVLDLVAEFHPARA